MRGERGRRFLPTDVRVPARVRPRVWTFLARRAEHARRDRDRHDESAKGDAFPKDSPGKVNGATGPNPITKFTDGQDIIGMAVTYIFN